jgi:hypothetical protein
MQPTGRIESTLMPIERESELIGHPDRVSPGKGPLRAAIVLPADSVGDEDSLCVGFKPNSPPSLPNTRAELLLRPGQSWYECGLPGGPGSNGSSKMG